MHCPRCGSQYAFFEKKCTRCNIDLVEGDAPEAGPVMFAASRDEDQPPNGGELPDASLVSVFKTSDPGLLPLATMALEGEGIEYFVKNAGKSDSLQWMMSQDPTNRPIAVEILVGSDVAAKARDLLVDLENPMPSAAPSGLSPSADLAASEPPTVTLEDDGVRRVHDAVRDFEAAMRGEAVHEQRVGACRRHKRFVDLERREDALAFVGLFFLSHRRPRIGVDRVGACDCRTRVADELERVAPWRDTLEAASIAAAGSS